MGETLDLVDIGVAKRHSLGAILAWSQVYAIEWGRARLRGGRATSDDPLSLDGLRGVRKSGVHLVSAYATPSAGAGSCAGHLLDR